MTTDYEIGGKVWVLDGGMPKQYRIRQILRGDDLDGVSGLQGDECYLLLKTGSRNCLWSTREIFASEQAVNLHLASEYRKRAASLIRYAEALEGKSR